MSGRADYEERKQARIDRMNEAAQKATDRSNQYGKEFDRMMERIPMGQPIITGRGARTQADINYRERAGRKIERAVEESDKASYYAERIEAAESNTAISSDDPAAIEKLREKGTRLEAERDRVKAANKEAKKNGTEPAPWYTLPYLSRDIKAAKDRIAKLERIDNMPAELIRFDGGEIESDPITNRVMIRFGERQGADVAERLKHNGFRWAPSVKAWQRMRNRNALWAAKEICGIDPKETQP